MRHHVTRILGPWLPNGILYPCPQQSLPDLYRHRRSFQRTFSSPPEYSPINIARIHHHTGGRPIGLYLEVCSPTSTRSLVIPIQAGDNVGALCGKVQHAVGSPRVDIRTNPPESILISSEESALKLLDIEDGFHLHVAKKTTEGSQSIEVLPSGSSSQPGSDDAERLTALKEQRREMLALQKDIQDLALRKTNKYAIGGVVLFSLEWVLVYYGTYCLYGWDVMEPITYLLALLDVIVTYAFFMLWREDFSPKTLQQVIYARHERKLSKARGFDVEVQKAVEREITLLKKKLKK